MLSATKTTIRPDNDYAQEGLVFKKKGIFMHPFAKRYSKLLPIAEGHLLQLHTYRASGGAVDEDWYEFIECDKNGGFVAKFSVYSAHNNERPSKSEHSFRKYDKTDTLIDYGAIQPT